jgi:hypothetical protein
MDEEIRVFVEMSAAGKMGDGLRAGEAHCQA